jgi:chorismate mutase
MTNTELINFRYEIDAIDSKIVALLAKRFHVAEKVAHFKQEHGLAVRLQDRINAVLDNSVVLAIQNRVDPTAIRAIYQTIIETTCNFEEMKKG